jgi:hypothetical protein
MVELSNEQRHQLVKQDDRPLRVCDPDTNKIYFIITADLFQRFQTIFGDDTFDVSDSYEAQSAAARQVGMIPKWTSTTTTTPIGPKHESPARRRHSRQLPIRQRNLYTVRQDTIVRRIGSLATKIMASVNDALKASLDVS